MRVLKDYGSKFPIYGSENAYSFDFTKSMDLIGVGSVSSIMAL